MSGWEVCEKMLSVTNQEIENQNNETPLRLVRMASIINTKGAGDHVEKKELLHTAGGRQISTSNMENSINNFSKVKDRTTIGFTNFTTEYVSKRHEIIILKRHHTFRFTAAVCTVAKI